MRKTFTSFSLLIGTLIGLAAVPITSNAKTLPALKTSKVTYTPSTKKFNVTVTAPKQSKYVALTYKKHTHYYKLSHNRVKISYKFSGYGNFKLTGVNSRHQHVTKSKKLTQASYATPIVLDFGIQRTATQATISIGTLGPNQTVTLYNSTKVIARQSNEQHQRVNFTLPLSSYTSYGKKLNYTVKAANKKTSTKRYLEYLKQAGNISVIE